MAVLVKFSKDWADEFDVYGFRVYDSLEAWEAAKGDLSELEYSFGTNEGWEEGDFEDSDFTMSLISDDEASLLTKLFGQSWGNFPL